MTHAKEVQQKHMEKTVPVRGLYCNQACSHCHVESSPLRKEMMSEDVLFTVSKVSGQQRQCSSKEVVERCLLLLKNSPTVKARAPEKLVAGWQVADIVRRYWTSQAALRR